MALEQKLKKIGGSLGLLIPRDIAKAMGIENGSTVRLTLVDQHLVVEPVSTSAEDDAAFARAWATTQQIGAPTFQALADYDRGQALGQTVRQERARASRKTAGVKGQHGDKKDPQTED